MTLYCPSGRLKEADTSFLYTVRNFNLAFNCILDVNYDSICENGLISLNYQLSFKLARQLRAQLESKERLFRGTLEIFMVVSIFEVETLNNASSEFVYR